MLVRKIKAYLESETLLRKSKPTCSTTILTRRTLITARENGCFAVKQQIKKSK